MVPKPAGGGGGGGGNSFFFFKKEPFAFVSEARRFESSSVYSVLLSFLLWNCCPVRQRAPSTMFSGAEAHPHPPFWVFGFTPF